MKRLMRKTKAKNVYELSKKVAYKKSEWHEKRAALSSSDSDSEEETDIDEAIAAENPADADSAIANSNRGKNTGSGSQSKEKSRPRNRRANKYWDPILTTRSSNSNSVESEQQDTPENHAQEKRNSKNFTSASDNQIYIKPTTTKTLTAETENHDGKNKSVKTITKRTRFKEPKKSDSEESLKSTMRSAFKTSSKSSKNIESKTWTNSCSDTGMDVYEYFYDFTRKEIVNIGKQCRNSKSKKVTIQKPFKDINTSNESITQPDFDLVDLNPTIQTDLDTDSGSSNSDSDRESDAVGTNISRKKKPRLTREQKEFEEALSRISLLIQLPYRDGYGNVITPAFEVSCNDNYRQVLIIVESERRRMHERFQREKKSGKLKSEITETETTFTPSLTEVKKEEKEDVATKINPFLDKIDPDSQLIKSEDYACPVEADNDEITEAVEVGKIEIRPESIEKMLKLQREILNEPTTFNDPHRFDAFDLTELDYNDMEVYIKFLVFHALQREHYERQAKVYGSTADYYDPEPGFQEYLFLPLRELETVEQEDFGFESSDGNIKHKRSSVQFSGGKSLCSRLRNLFAFKRRINPVKSFQKSTKCSTSRGSSQLSESEVSISSNEAIQHKLELESEVNFTKSRREDEEQRIVDDYNM